jgi:hypothetical protein
MNHRDAVVQCSLPQNVRKISVGRSLYCDFPSIPEKKYRENARQDSRVLIIGDYVRVGLHPCQTFHRETFTTASDAIVR